MNVEEIKSLSVERFLKRNEELFSFLEELKDRAPEPIVDFHPEEGELQIKWISQKVWCILCPLTLERIQIVEFL